MKYRWTDWALLRGEHLYQLLSRRFVEIVESNVLSSLYSYKKMGSSYNGLSIICTVLNCTVYLQHRIKERRKMKMIVRKLFLCVLLLIVIPHGWQAAPGLL